MGSISDYLEDELLDHVFNAAYTPASTVYLALSLAFSIRNSTYRWTASGSGTSEYYLELAAGGDPGLDGDPEIVIANGVQLAAGTMGSLTAGTWDYGDNDTLGYSTIYVRLADSTDPDTKAEDFVLAGGNPFEDEGGLVEPSSGSYARTAISFGAASSRRVTQSADVEFPTATAEWGWVTHYAVMDALTSGNMLAYGRLTTARQIVTNNTLTIPTSEVYVEFSAGGMSTYLANELLDHAFRNATYTKPDTFVALTTATISDTSTGSTITEVAGTGYARVEVNAAGGDSPAWAAASNGLVTNDDQIDIGPPSADDWGTVVAVAIVDASSDGNLLFYGNDVVDQAIGDGDTVFFAAGDLDISLA